MSSRALFASRLMRACRRNAISSCGASKKTLTGSASRRMTTARHPLRRGGYDRNVGGDDPFSLPSSSGLTRMNAPARCRGPVVGVGDGQPDIVEHHGRLMKYTLYQGLRCPRSRSGRRGAFPSSCLGHHDRQRRMRGARNSLQLGQVACCPAPGSQRCAPRSGQSWCSTDRGLSESSASRSMTVSRLVATA